MLSCKWGGVYIYKISLAANRKEVPVFIIISNDMRFSVLFKNGNVVFLFKIVAEIKE